MFGRSDAFEKFWESESLNNMLRDWSGSANTETLYAELLQRYLHPHEVTVRKLARSDCEYIQGRAGVSRSSHYQQCSNVLSALREVRRNIGWPDRLNKELSTEPNIRHDGTE